MLIIISRSEPRLVKPRQDVPKKGPIGGTGTVSSALHAGLWGLARTARMEEPSLRLRCVDLEREFAETDVTELMARFQGVKSDETEIAVRDGLPQVSRLARSQVQVQKPMRLQMSSRGSLSNLRPVAQTMRSQRSSSQVELRVRSVGLNFRDVLNVMNLYPGDPGNPGADCAGTVCSGHAAGLRPGQDVFGIAWGCLQTYACTDALLLAPKHPSWSFEQMAAWSVTFATTEEAFKELAELRQGERVLIHAATGGVGLVAVQFAQRVGAKVFATAGSESKVQHLHDLGVKYVTSSRDAKQFEEDMQRFLEEDGGGGLDVVLNSLRHGIS